MNQTNEKLQKEIQSFKDLWQGGYYEGNPAEPLARSAFAQIGYMSVLHATYLRCIKPYINRETVALEIGPGRGAWTKTMLDAREVWTLDAVSAEHTRFWDYIGENQHVRYLQVNDFSCADLPDDYFNYVFSFGCFCHISFTGIEEYAKNLFPKLKSGADCFWLVADYEQFNRVVSDLQRYSVWSGAAPVGRRFSAFRKMLEWLMRMDNKPQPMKPDADDQPNAEGGRWYHAGRDRTCEMLQKYGYEIVDKDVGTVMRDPIIHFYKP